MREPTRTTMEVAIETEYGSLVGCTVLKVRALTETELADLGWDDDPGAAPMVIFLTNGKALIPSRDPEGNGPGHLFLDSWSTVKA